MFILVKSCMVSGVGCEHPCFLWQGIVLFSCHIPIAIPKFACRALPCHTSNKDNLKTSQTKQTQIKHTTPEPQQQNTICGPNNPKFAELLQHHFPPTKHHKITPNHHLRPFKSTTKAGCEPLGPLRPLWPSIAAAGARSAGDFRH